MSSTPDWMRGDQDLDGHLRASPPLAGLVIWALALVVVTTAALALRQLIG